MTRNFKTDKSVITDYELSEQLPSGYVAISDSDDSGFIYDVNVDEFVATFKIGLYEFWVDSFQETELDEYNSTQELLIEAVNKFNDKFFL